MQKILKGILLAAGLSVLAITLPQLLCSSSSDVWRGHVFDGIAMHLSKSQIELQDVLQVDGQGRDSDLKREDAEVIGNIKKKISNLKIDAFVFVPVYVFLIGGLGYLWGSKLDPKNPMQRFLRILWIALLILTGVAAGVADQVENWYSYKISSALVAQSDAEKSSTIEQNAEELTIEVQWQAVTNEQCAKMRTASIWKWGALALVMASFSVLAFLQMALLTCIFYMLSASFFLLSFSLGEFYIDWQFAFMGIAWLSTGLHLSQEEAGSQGR